MKTLNKDMEFVEVEVLEIKSKKFRYLSFIFKASLFFNIVLLLFILLYKPNCIYIKSPIEYTYQFDSLHIDTIKTYIKEKNIRFGDVLIAQILLESGELQSQLTIRTNNLVGMRIATKRPTTAIGNYKGYAIYRSWKESVIDYTLWQKQNTVNIKTEEEYINYLNKVYAEDSGYNIKIKNILNNLRRVK